MIRSVASRTSSSGAIGTGGPTTTVSATPVRHAGLRPLNRIRCVPHSPTGVTGTPLAWARRAVPDFPAIGSRSSEIVPSGNTVTHSPRRSASTAASSDDAASARAPAHRDLAGASAAAARAAPSRRARPWRGTAPAGAGGRPGTRGRADRGTRRGCSRGSPGPAPGPSARPRSSTGCRGGGAGTARREREHTSRPRSVAYADSWFPTRPDSRARVS